MDALANGAALSIRHVRNKLQTLSTTLGRKYDEAMERVHDQESDRKHVALKKLAWISDAFRSLSLRELQHAVAIQHQETDLDEELIMNRASITAMCAGLVVIDQRTNLMNLFHYTTKNYFEQIHFGSSLIINATITLNCATFHTFEVFKDANIWKILLIFPLTGYAVQHMADHARQNPEDNLEPFILEILIYNFTSTVFYT